MKKTVRQLERDVKLTNLVEFEKEHGDKDGGFESREIAADFMKRKMDWWGSNLVSLGIEEKDGKFYPQFNVFD